MSELKFNLRGIEACIQYDMLTTGNLRPYELMDKFVPQEEGVFENDVYFQLNFLLRKSSYVDLTGEDFFGALKAACKEHISIYGRLLDSDLYSLVDCTVQILYAIHAYNKSSLSNVYKHLAWDTMQEFEEYMWEANKYGISKMNIYDFHKRYMQNRYDEF